MAVRKPIWTEGLFITQHHFQQLDDYHERLLDERLGSIVPYSWGVLDMTIDERALEAGSFKLSQLTAIMPDGNPISCGDETNDALQRPIGDSFSAQMPSLDIYVAVPQAGDFAANVDLEASPGALARFIRQETRVADFNTGRGEHAWGWARPNVQLLFGEERRDAFHTMKVATLTRSSTGAVITQPSYVPPALRIGTSKFIMSGLRNLLEATVGRQRSLAQARRQRSEAAIDFQATDLSKLLLLNVLNSHIPGMSHLLDQKNAHPERAYELLASFAGQLCTFATDGDPTQLPQFNYLELGPTFEALFARITRLLDAVISERFVEIPMQRREDGMYLARIEDGSLLRYEFFLGAKGNVPGEQLRERLPKLAKVASWSQVTSILNSAINGARLELQYTPPSALPVKPGVVFFKVTKVPEYWTDIQGTGTLAVYQPLEPRNVELSLYAVDPQNL